MGRLWEQGVIKFFNHFSALNRLVSFLINLQISKFVILFGESGILSP